MLIKANEPTVKVESLPDGWTAAEVNTSTLHTSFSSRNFLLIHYIAHLQMESPDNPMSTSSGEKLPTGVPEVREKTFCPPDTQRGEGQPSAKLKEYLGMGSARNSEKWSIQRMMLSLFLWFFTFTTLDQICKYTNEKATEMVYKQKHQRSDGKYYYRVSTWCMCMHVCVYACMCMHACMCVYM